MLRFARCPILTAGLTLFLASLARGEPPRVEANQLPKSGGPVRTDCYGDPLPPGALARMGTVRLRDVSQVFSVAFSPDGKFLAGGGQGDDIPLWEVATGKRIRRFAEVPERVESVAFSPDGKTLAV